MIRIATRCAALVLLFATLSACPLAAQTRPVRPPRGQSPAPVEQAPVRDRDFRADDQSARETRERLHEIFRQYPPSLAEVLRFDPSLLSNEAYLTPYPVLASFLAQHPEVAHNPGYFLGEFRDSQWQNDPRRQVIQLMEGVLAGLAIFLGFVTVVGVIVWLLKSLLEYRRWLRLSKVQTEAHSKLLDRLTSNEDLLAYIQSSPGRRFLESAPIPLDPATRPISAPVGRILWSVQAGMVVAMGGLGLLYVSHQIPIGNPAYSDLSLPMFVLGIVALALGGGFVLSAIVAYIISLRLGLFDSPPLTPHA
jgi:hypothetical protein